jgi:hypothetical protein
MMPSEVVFPADRNGSRTAELIPDTGKQVLENRLATWQERMCMLPLRDTPAWLWSSGERIALDQRDMIEVPRENTRPKESGYTPAGNNRMTKRTAGHDDLPPLAIEI